MRLPLRIVRRLPRGLRWRELERLERMTVVEQARSCGVLLIVSTMGKVGSKSVHASLRAQCTTLPAMHTHYLTDYWSDDPRRSMADDAFHARLPNRRFGIHKTKAYRRLIASLPDHRLKIITLVREPVAREISEAFENWRDIFPVRRVDQLTREMVTSYLDRHLYGYALRWFEAEFERWTSLDIYSCPFDRSMGYAIYEAERFDLLVMKLESLDACFSEAIGRFLGVHGVELVRSNVTEGKPGKGLYREIVETYRPAQAKLSRLYAAPLVTHFYSDAEIAGFRARWST